MADIAELLGRTLVLVAHPDDESIACATLLQRMESPVVLFATDGAPMDEYFWGRFGSRENYAAHRKVEVQNAMREIGVREFVHLADHSDVPDRFIDQRLFINLPEAYESIAAQVRRVEPAAILTLAYEGGHPDHDSCSLLGACLGERFDLPVWEAPLYNRATGVQRFINETGEEVLVAGSEQELERKAAMCRAYESQGDFLGFFPLEREIVRPQVKYDYSKPPHAGKVNYEQWQWWMTAREVSDKFVEFEKTVCAGR